MKQHQFTSQIKTDKYHQQFSNKMSGPPQGHLCGKTLLHTRGFGLKILQLQHPITPKYRKGAQQTLTSTRHQQSQAN